MNPLQWTLAAIAALAAVLAGLYLVALGYDEWLYRREQRETDAASDYWRRIGKDKP